MSRKKQQHEQDAAFEQRIRNTQYPVKDPRKAYVTQLFESLQQQRSNQRVAAAQPEQHAKESWIKNLFKMPATIGAVSFAVVALVAVGIWQLLPSQTAPTYIAQNTYTTIPYPTDGELDNLFTLEPIEETENGIVATTGFRLTSAIEFTEEQVREALSFKPQAAYAAELTEELQFLIRTETAFEGDSLVTAQMNVQFEREDGSTVTRTYSWTYQVEDTFKVNSTFPANQSNDVPVNSSIEIDLSHSDIQYGDNVFSIEPVLAGSVEQHRSRLVFVPSEEMQKSTVYTVTINEDLTQESTGEVIAAGTSFQFETSYGDRDDNFDKQFRIETTTAQTSSTKNAYLILNGDYGTKNPVTLKVYSMSRDQYVAALQEKTESPTWAYYAPEPEIDLTGLAVVMEAEVDLQEVNYYQRVLEFPDTLGEGYYYAEVTRAERTGGQMLQVSDISAFNAVSRTDTVVWSHNAATGEPLSGVTASFIGAGEIGTTGSNGLMQEPTPEAALAGLRTELMLLEGNGSELVLPLAGSMENSYERVENVTAADLVTPVKSFIHTSKPFYKPTDTVSAWGVIKAQDFQPLGEVEVAFGNYGWRENEESEVYSTQVTPDQFGAYDVHFPLGGLQPGTYDLVVKVDGVIVRRHYVEVLNYQLPAYSLSVTPSRLAVFEGDTATHVVSAELYDGTPLTGTDVRIGTYDDDNVYTTGSDGKIYYENTYQDVCYQEHLSWGQVCTDWINVHPAEGEEGTIDEYFEVQVFQSAYGAKWKARTNDGEVTASGTVHTVDLNAYNTGEATTPEDALTDTVDGVTVNFRVVERWTTKEETGSVYDPIKKRSIPQYDYKQNKREFTTGTTTTNKDGEFEYVIPNTNDKRDYTVFLSLTDEQGRTVSYERWAYQEYEADSSHHFYKVSLDGAEQWDARQYYKTGETVTARMLDNAQLLPEDDSYLFVQARNGIRETAVQESPVYQFEFDDQDIPSVVIMGVWYDGSAYWATQHRTGIFESGAQALLDTEDRQLNATVNLNAETFGPGDTVVMDMEFTGGENAREETAVHVVVIDEALFDLQHTWLAGPMQSLRDKYFADSYYRGHGSGIYGTYSSHQASLDSFGAEGGGGGENRTDLSDQAAFITTTTGSDGTAQVQFDLPDSLTTWHVVVYAIDGEEYIAEEVRSITTTLPVQATAVLNDVYQAGDQPEVKVRAYGTELSQEEKVTLTIESEDLGLVQEARTVTGSEDAYFTLPELPVGQHTITFGVVAGDKQDFVERKITVRPSLLSVPVVEQVTLEGEWSPQINARYGAHVTITDQSIGQFYPYLRNAYWQSTDRLDYLAARERATSLLAEWFGETVPTPDVDYSVYQQAEDGGLQLFTYGGVDLFSSVLVTAALEGHIDGSRLTRYYNNIFDEPTEGTRRHAQALAGLATLRQPVLNEAEQMLAHEEVTYSDRVYIAYALAKMGAFEEARAVMEELSGEYIGSGASTPIVPDAAELAELNIIAAITMATLQMDGADELFADFLDNAPESIVRDLGTVEYIAARISHVPMQPATVTYQKDGQQYTEELEPGRAAVIRLAADQLEGFAVTGYTGAVMANMEYQALDAERTTTAEGLSITRTADWDFAQEGDIVPVTIRVEGAEDQGFTVTDTIPAGFRIITNPNIFITGWYSEPNYASPYSIDQQQVRFYGRSYNKTYTYYVQAVQPGVYTADAPLVQLLDDPTQQAFGQVQQVQLSR